MSEAVDLELKDMDQYYGTMQYFFNPLFKAVKYTDGVKYVSDNGYAWFVSDVLAILAHAEELKDEEFIVIDLQRDECGGCDVFYADGMNKLLYRQTYKFSDAKRDVKLYFTGGVLMLAKEY